MSTRLIQYKTKTNPCVVAVIDADDDGTIKSVHDLNTVDSVYDLAMKALDADVSLAAMIEQCRGAAIDLETIVAANNLIAPIHHGDPAHMILAGTGLTHLGSAEGRDKMHQGAAGQNLTDSMRMFNMGLEGGKPEVGQVGVQPEWFYKGDGSLVVAPNGALTSPDFALDGGEEPEIAGIYINDAKGQPRRIGFALANEFSDHVTEQGNYLWLAHSKIRQAAIGPEIYIDPLPSHVHGTSKIIRGGKTVWEKPFVSGEDNMSHTFENLEHHHFKYDSFRRPGDVHVHFMGTATLSCADGFKTQDGDVFEIDARPFSLALSNPLKMQRTGHNELCAVKPL